MEFHVARIQDEKKLHHQIDQCLAADDTTGLYLTVLDYLRQELETSSTTKGCMKKVRGHSGRECKWRVYNLRPGVSCVGSIEINLQVLYGINCFTKNPSNQRIHDKFWTRNHGDSVFRNFEKL